MIGFKGNGIAREQMKGFGVMISFEVKGGLEAAFQKTIQDYKEYRGYKE